MKKYQKLKQEIYDLDALPPEQQSVYETVWNFYQQAPDWDTFTAFWLAQIDRLCPQLSRTRLWPFLSRQGGERVLTIDHLCERSHYRRRTAHAASARSYLTRLSPFCATLFP